MLCKEKVCLKTHLSWCTKLIYYLKGNKERKIKFNIKRKLYIIVGLINYIYGTLLILEVKINKKMVHKNVD